MDEKALKDLICQRFLDGDTDFPLDADTRLLDEGICDSLGLVQLAGAIEKRLPGLKIQDQDITKENFGSIAAIRAYLARRGRP